MFFTEKCGMNIRQKGRRGCELRQRRSLHSDQRRMFFYSDFVVTTFQLTFSDRKGGMCNAPFDF